MHMFEKGRVMTPKGEKIYTLTPEELLGRPLNDIESKYAPKKLYATGNAKKIPLSGPRAAIIGSRKASLQGLRAASDIARALAGKGVVIISGLAEGIDTAAHKTTIEQGGQTIAVLGTPLDQVYPQKNLQLQETIKRHHLAIYQFPIGYPIQPKNFVLRNRTMALISDASIIVEAGYTSGSLHEGWEALRLGRPLFIWKSVMNDSSLSWPKKMLDYGAVELKKPEAVVDLLPSSEISLEINVPV
ncbi:MAG: DNA-protecting protein DprA [Thaumarchaeota archaeon]|nr:DNA-protecting protein DprA [Nitrososphaerota archaeon]